MKLSHFMQPAKRVVICEAAVSATASGIQLAEGDDKKSEMGVVAAIGAGNMPVPIQVGDQIVFRKYSDNRIMVAGKEYNFIDFKDVLAVIPQGKK